jgi:hypothetical protein
MFLAQKMRICVGNIQLENLKLRTRQRPIRNERPITRRVKTTGFRERRMRRPR